MINAKRIIEKTTFNGIGQLAFFLILCIVTGVLIGTDFKFSFLLLGLTALVGYILLAYIRPFAAFVIFIFLALTVWLSSVELIGNISIMIGLGLVFTTVWLSRLVIHDTVFVQVREYLLVLGIAAVVAVSSIIHLNGPAGLAAALTYFQLLLLFVLVVNFVTSSSQLHAMGSVIIASSTLLAVVILLGQVGWLPAELVGEQTASVNTGNSVEIVSRTRGLLGDANFTAMQLILALPFIIEWLPIARSWWRRALLLISSAAILVAFTFTFSVGGVMGLATIVLVKLIRASRRSILLTVVKSSLFLIIAAWALSVILPDLYLQRTLIKVDGTLEAVRTQDPYLLLEMMSGRGDIWQATVNAILDSPLFGHGPGNAGYANVKYSFLFGHREAISPHNMILTVTSDLGLIGFLFFAGLLISALLAARQRKLLGSNDVVLRRNGEAIFMALAVYIVQGMAIDIHAQKHLWVLLGMAIVYGQLYLSHRSVTYYAGVEN